jgi:hypothetical protein
MGGVLCIFGVAVFRCGALALFEGVLWSDIDIKFIPNTLAFLLGVGLLGSGLVFGTLYLAAANKSPWKIGAAAVSGFLGGYLVAHGAQMFLDAKLASFNRRSENARVTPMIVAELKLRDIRRHILGVDLVERAEIPRLKMLQEPSIVLVCTAPTT